MGEGTRAHQANGRAAPGPVGSSTGDLRLIGGFEFRVGNSPVRVGVAAQRLLALLAARETPMSRHQAALVLWPDCPAGRATANLRTLVWRLQRSLGLLDTSFRDLRLAGGVRVDVHSVSDAARVLLTRATSLGEHQLDALTRTNFYGDLLPGWSEVWLTADRERFRQLRLHALEVLSFRLSAMRRHRAAIEAGRTVVGTDPLRESGYFALISAYLAAERCPDACREFQRYASLVRAELKIEPSQRLVEMIRSVAHPSHPHHRVCPPEVHPPRQSQEGRRRTSGPLPEGTDDLPAVAKIFRTLGDPNRLRLLEFLLGGERTVTECVTHVGLSQGRVSSHLACLAGCGYVEVRRTGRSALYSVADQRIVQLVALAWSVVSGSRAEADHEE